MINREELAKHILVSVLVAAVFAFLTAIYVAVGGSWYSLDSFLVDFVASWIVLSFVVSLVLRAITSDKLGF